MDVTDEAGRERIDEAMEAWRQGDCVLGEHWFLFRLDIGAPLTGEAAEAAAEGVDTGEAEVRGLMVATQTCDIVRGCGERPFVEVCPLVEVDPEKLERLECESPSQVYDGPHRVHGNRPRRTTSTRRFPVPGATSEDITSPCVASGRM